MNKMIEKIVLLSRFNKQLILFIFDSIAIIMAIFTSFSLKLGYLYLPQGDFVWLIFGSPIVAIPIFIFFRLHRTVIRFISFRGLWSIFQATTLYSLLWVLIVFMTNIGEIPRSVILINWILVTLVIVVSRLFARLLLSNENIANENVLIYGAGSAGRQLSNALTGSKAYKPIAFIDDDDDIHHQSINGLKVFSSIELKGLIEKKNIKEVFIAIPSLTRVRRNEIIKYLEPYPLVVRSLPSLSDLETGIIRINDLLEIDLRDLLGREAVLPNKNLLKVNIYKKTVLVTGAGGSIGSELCRQILFLKPKKLVLFDISESSLYIIEQELLNINAPNIEIIPVIGSVVDQARVEVICKYYSVATIYHTAAYKHVPLVEFNQSQGVINNILGTLSAAKAAISSNVEIFVLISTDKAVRPTNVMGASKRIAELVLQAFAKQDQVHNTCFTIVRFGNVLDSSGSVIPLFKKQIKAGGPVTVTHIDIVRFFMTIPEAVELVIQAGAMAKGGELFVLDMGEPIRIHDLAVKMIQLSGLVVRNANNPEGDIEIKYTGLRPGEKLYEELLIDGGFTDTETNLIMSAEERMIDWDKLEPLINEIEVAAKVSDTEKIYKLLKKIVPEYDDSIEPNHKK